MSVGWELPDGLEVSRGTQPIRSPLTAITDPGTATVDEDGRPPVARRAGRSP